MGFSAPQLPCFQKSLSVPLLRFDAASIPKFQIWLFPAHHFGSSSLPLFFFPPLFLQEDESLGITPFLCLCPHQFWNPCTPGAAQRK